MKTHCRDLETCMSNADVIRGDGLVAFPILSDVCRRVIDRWDRLPKGVKCGIRKVSNVKELP